MTPRAVIAPQHGRGVTWRQGTRGAMRSRFAAVRVRPAHRDDGRSTPRPEEWLLIEWPRPEAAPIKYWLSTLPPTATRADLVQLAMLRWRIERDYQELKDELGLDHFEGRGWRGFHHHASLCIAAYAFLAAERLAHSPLSRWPSSRPLAYPNVSSRGALPVRPERHVPESIATMYRLLAAALARGLPCLTCGHQSPGLFSATVVLALRCDRANHLGAQGGSRSHRWFSEGASYDEPQSRGSRRTPPRHGAARNGSWTWWRATRVGFLSTGTRRRTF